MMSHGTETGNYVSFPAVTPATARCCGIIFPLSIYGYVVSVCKVMLATRPSGQFEQGENTFTLHLKLKVCVETTIWLQFTGFIILHEIVSLRQSIIALLKC